MFATAISTPIMGEVTPRLLALLVPLVCAFGAPVASAEPPNPLYQLVDTATQRLLTADPVAASKWINGGPITDTARADQVLDDVGADAVTHRVDPEYVRAIFRNQVDATEGVEYSLFGQWKFDAKAAPGTAPDLSASRTAIDGYNRAMVDEIARQWDSLHAGNCPAELGDAQAAIVSARQLDPLYQQALHAATRSYCA